MPTTQNTTARKSKSNTDIAVETLKKLILENELQPGTNHLEGELAEKLGMSRTPVREATLILQTQGLLEIVPRHGVKILKTSIRDMKEIYEVLTALEGFAAKLAAEKQHQPQEYQPAKKAIELMDEALKSDNREAWALADEKFHGELIKLAGNERIGGIVDVVNDQVRRARSLTLYLRPVPLQSNDDHRKLLEAIEAGDAETAKKVHTEHRVRAGKLLISILEKHRLIMV